MAAARRQRHLWPAAAGAEVIDEVFGSDASIVFTHTEDRMHRIKDRAGGDAGMRLVIALGGNALLRRGPALSADNQLDKVVEAASRFAAETGKRALIGSLEHIEAMLEGEAGTEVRPDADDAPSGSARQVGVSR